MSEITRPFRVGRTILAAGVALASLFSCQGLFQLGPRPAQLAGVWIDSAATTPSDTFSRILDPGGADRSTHTSVVRGAHGQHVLTTVKKRNGWWWVRGGLADTMHRQLCLTRRSGRNPGTCVAFYLDSVTTSGSAAGTRRRLILWTFDDKARQHGRVFLERMP